MGNAKEASDRHFAAFNAHDLDANAANETPDIEWVQPGGISLRGRDQVRTNQMLLWDAFPDAKVTATNQIVANPYVVTEAVLTGTHTGTLRTPNGDISPTGRSIKLRYATVQRVEGDLISSEHLYFDQAEMMAQLGLLPGA